ncbi:hypothetical protein CHS0354_030615 [Potamilus streckersoni]|uniref:CARD domain-containing protein n=1 Tax=Potamilus streckersoni TaxID=2493646 RepID=A0AAE0SCF7_9BIVA|nr:hypothetical protein CHS0354_030615 [Potamilus streckersoni]
MDKLDQKKITRNLTFIKDRIGVDINAFVDRLIEKDVFEINVKEDIESAQPPTLQAKTDIFIRKLLRSGPTSFKAFRDILVEKGNLDVVDKMDEIGAEDAAADDESVLYKRSGTFVIRESERLDGASGVVETGNIESETSQDQLMASLLVRLQEQTKRELRDEFERKRQQDKETLDKRLALDKQEHEETMVLLKSRLEQIAKVSEDYEKLKMTQKGLREQLNRQRDQVMNLKQENKTLTKEMTILEGVKDENKSLSDENENLKIENTELKIEIQKLERQLTDKENELSDLKSYIEKQYSMLSLKLSDHKQEWKGERENLEYGLNKQQKMLTDIAQAIQAINKKMEKESPPEPAMNNLSQALLISRPSTNGQPAGLAQTKPFIPGTKSTPRSSNNKFLKSGVYNPRKK